MNDLKIKQIFDKLQDDESRMIFKHRLLHYLDGSNTHLFNMLDELNVLNLAPSRKFAPEIYSRMSEFVEIYRQSPAPIIAYGAGIQAEFILPLVEYKCSKVTCLCDTNPELWGAEKYGYHIISPEALIKDYDTAYIIISTFLLETAQPIYDKLLTLGFKKEKIFWFPAYEVGVRQYFGSSFIKPAANEIYVDAGCFDGYTIGTFIEFCSGNYKKIWAMEPDSINMKRVREYVEKNNFLNITLVEKGAWSEEDVLLFSNTSNGSSQISDTGAISVPVTSIDEMVGDDVVTFIKMDIEGAELEALKGAAKTIIKNKKINLCELLTSRECAMRRREVKIRRANSFRP